MAFTSANTAAYEYVTSGLMRRLRQAAVHGTKQKKKYELRLRPLDGRWQGATTKPLQLVTPSMAQTRPVP